MHPVRVHTLDVTAGTLLIGGQFLRHLERVETVSYGLHYANLIPDHPRVAHVEAHVLPALDIVVSRFTSLRAEDSHLYVDMATSTAEGEAWTVRDLYLDVTVYPDCIPRLVDMDEYVEAIQEGHLTPDEQRRALLSAERVVNGLFAHGHDLEAWLSSLDIELHWWSA